MNKLLSFLLTTELLLPSNYGSIKPKISSYKSQAINYVFQKKKTSDYKNKISTIISKSIDLPYSISASDNAVKIEIIDKDYIPSESDDINRYLKPSCQSLTDAIASYLDVNRVDEPKVTINYVSSDGNEIFKCESRGNNYV